jgi:hypothetical protein
VTLVDTSNMMEMTIYIVLYIYCYMSVLYILLYLICYIPVNPYKKFRKNAAVAYRKRGSVAYTSVAYSPVRHCYDIHLRRTSLYATDTKHTRGVQTYTPRVGVVAVVYRPVRHGWVS